MSPRPFRAGPLAYSGMRIGLFGGSFDPAHEGHAHVAETALKRLGLDRLWWLVSPQNPLKPQSGPLTRRMQSAERMARGARMVVSDLESKLGCAYTYQTLRALKRRYPGVHFVFVMGEDNIASFKRWRNWREITEAIPIVVVSRPKTQRSARSGMPRKWTYLSARYHPHSSTELRRQSGAVAEPA